jgi:hypothetical protein
MRKIDVAKLPLTMQMNRSRSASVVSRRQDQASSDRTLWFEKEKKSMNNEPDGEVRLAKDTVVGEAQLVGDVLP